MKHWFRAQPHPFRLLQITEWILLGIAVPSELPWEDLPYLYSLLGEVFAETELIPTAWVLLCLMVLGLLGLRLPNGSVLSKWAYITAQFGLIVLANILGQILLLTPFLVVVIRGCLIFRRRGRWWVSGLAMGLAIAFLAIPSSDIQGLYSDYFEPSPMTLEQFQFTVQLEIINDIFLFGLNLIFVLVLVNTLLAERSSRQQLAAAHHQLRQYALRIEDQATLQERNRIAREIHDAVGHNLTALRIQLENAVMLCQVDSQQEVHLQAAQQLAAKALTEIRQSVATLRADPLQGKPLHDALQFLCHTFQHQITGELVYALQISAPVKREVSTTVYRLAQEALTNVMKHSQANQIKLRIQSNFDELWLMVEDNGIGFDPTQTTAGFGLNSMQERAVAMGGQLSIVTAPGQGCQLTAKLPLTSLSS